MELSLVLYLNVVMENEMQLYLTMGRPIIEPGTHSIQSMNTKPLDHNFYLKQILLK
jgi:hypothetical protein